MDRKESSGCLHKLSDSRSGSTSVSQSQSKKNLRFNMTVEQRMIPAENTNVPLFGTPARAKLLLDDDSDDSDSEADSPDVVISVIPKDDHALKQKSSLTHHIKLPPRSDPQNQQSYSEPTSPYMLEAEDQILTYQGNEKARENLHVDIPMGKPPSPNMSPEGLF